MTEPTPVVMFCGECGARMWRRGGAWRRSCECRSPVYYSNVAPTIRDALLYGDLAGRDLPRLQPTDEGAPTLYRYGPIA